MEALLFENNSLLSDSTHQWAIAIAPNYTLTDPDKGLFYQRSNDLYTFAMLINPNLDKVITSSAFESIMSYGFCKAHGRSLEDEYLQIEYFAWLFYQAVGYRKLKNLPPIEFHINYLYPNFTQRLIADKIGKDTHAFIKLLLRQSEGFAKFFIYHEYLLKSVLSKEEDLYL